MVKFSGFGAGKAAKCPTMRKTGLHKTKNDAEQNAKSAKVEEPCFQVVIKDALILTLLWYDYIMLIASI